MRSLIAAWRVSLARTRADWPIVAAAWLVTVLAITLIAAAIVYPTAAAEAGLHRALADAPSDSTDVDVVRYQPAAGVPELDGVVRGELAGMFGAAGGIVIRDWRGDASLALEGLPGSTTGDQAIIGSLDGLVAHAELVAGEWPSPRAEAQEPLRVVVAEPVATELGLRVGDEFSPVARDFEVVPVPVNLVGIYRVTSTADPFWDNDDLLLTGMHDNGLQRTFGPFITTMDDLLAEPGFRSLYLQWRAYPAFSELSVEDVPALHGRVEALEPRLRGITKVDVEVHTGLSTILADIDRSLLVSRSGVLLVVAQLAILAGYAIVLTASLLVDHRRIDTAMLRSRGAGFGHVAGLALVEALLIVAPAVVIAPWIAAAVLNLFNVAGPLAEIRLSIAPRVTGSDYLAAVIAGIVCVALLVLPTALSARRFAAEQSGVSRQESRTFGQRTGIDIALLAVMALGLWQLQLYGAPLTTTVRGTLGLDPLLVAAPAIALLSGAVLALRVLPLLAEAVQVAFARGRSLVLALGSRQLARRPLRYTRSALLLMLALSMGVFAVSYSDTWTRSQLDQGRYQAGADVRVLPGRTTVGLPVWALPNAYEGLPSIERAAPAERLAGGASFPVGGGVDVLALDAAAASDILLLRGDESVEPLPIQLERLRAGRPEPPLATVPDSATHLRISPHFEIGAISRIVLDRVTGEERLEPLDPAGLSDLRIGVSLVIRDARGLLYRLASGLVPATSPDTVAVVELQPAAGLARDAVTATGARLARPLELAALGVDFWLPDRTVTTAGNLGIATVSAGDGQAGPWTAVPLLGGDPWTATMSQARHRATPVPDGQLRDLTVQLAGEGQNGVVFGVGNEAPSATLAFTPASIATAHAAIPVIANRALLTTLGAAEGQTVVAALAGGNRSLLISGVVERFPTTDPDRPLLVVDEPTLGLLRLQDSGGARAPDEWWLAAAGGDADRLAGDLRAAPFSTVSLVSVVERTRGLATDPVALGIIGAFTLGAIATGLFAMIGLIVSTAVGARQRRAEFALLRALGLSGRQLASSLWLENGSLVVVSLVAGTVLGLLLGWLVLPFVSVTQQATTPVPPLIIDVPWDRILLLDVASAVALAVAVVIVGNVLRRLGVGSVLRMGEE